MRNYPKEDQSYVHDADAMLPHESKPGHRGGGGRGIDRLPEARATEADHAQAWAMRRTGSRPERRPDIRHG